MGNALAGAQRKLVVLEQDPTTWRLEHVVEIRKKFVAKGWDFGVNKDQLSEIIQAVLPDPTHDVVEDLLWRRFYNVAQPNKHDATGEVYALEVFAGLAVMSLGRRRRARR